MSIRAELKPVILTPASRLTEKRLSVTTTMDSPKEITTRSRTFICLKKTSVQAKPGRNRTRAKPSMALITGTCSRRGKTNPTSSLSGDSQFMTYFPFLSTFILFGTADDIIRFA